MRGEDGLYAQCILVSLIIFQLREQDYRDPQVPGCDVVDFEAASFDTDKRLVSGKAH